MVGIIRRSQSGLGKLALTMLATISSLNCGGETAVRNGGADNSGGAAGNASGSCSTQRLTIVDATTLYMYGAFDVKPDFPPPTPSEVKELEVAGLWEALGAQLFDVIDTVGVTYPERTCTFLSYRCRLFLLAGLCSLAIGPASSGLVADGAFYYSWEWGSGDIRSQVAKLTPDGSGLKKIESAEYFNVSTGYPLIIRASGSDILAYRGANRMFNELPSSGSIGKLAEIGDRLTIVNDSGQEISTKLPW